MSEKKQSSVEWLYERLERMIPRTALYNGDKIRYLKQAKAMHKEEIKKAWEEGFSFSSPYQSAEIYYNETFGE